MRSAAEVPGLVHDSFRELRTGVSRAPWASRSPDVLQKPADVSLIALIGHDTRMGPDAWAPERTNRS